MRLCVTSMLGKFGGIIYQNGIRPSDVVLYCSRPGLRIWIADIKGLVEQTLLFKDILNQDYPEVPILNPLASNLKRLKPNKEASFGEILTFSDDFLITYNNDVLYILNPKEMKIIATVSHLRGVLDVAVNKDEIFILEGERSLIRIAFAPESIKEVSSNTPLATTTNTAFQPLATSIKEIRNKIQTTHIISAIPPPPPLETNNQQHLVHDEEGDATASVTNNHVEEAKECLVVNNIQVRSGEEETYSDKIYESYRKLEILNKIADEDFDETILYKHGRHKKQSGAGAAMDSMVTSASSISSSSVTPPNDVITKGTLMNMSAVGALPDLRSPDSIQCDIEAKERMLADLLNFDKPPAPLVAAATSKSDEDDGDGGKQQLNIDIKKDIERIINNKVDAPKVVADVSINETLDSVIPRKQETVKEKLNLGLRNIKQSVYRQLPIKWQITKVNIKKCDSHEDSNESLDDWEII